MAGRNPYTAREVEFLARYIAKYNPENAGRMGNKLYKDLVDNPDRWAWGKAHPWQSWRDYYVRHQREMDQVIKNKIREQRKQEKAAGTQDQSEKQGPKLKEQKQENRAKVNEEREDKRARPATNNGIAPDPNGLRQSAANAPAQNATVVDQRSRPVVTVPQDTAHEDSTAPVKPDPTGANSQLPPINTLVDVIDISGTDDELMRELFGSEGEGDETQQLDELQPTPPTESQAVKINLVSPIRQRPSEQGPIPLKSATNVQPRRAVTPPPAQKRRPKPKLRARIDDDPFGTPPHTKAAELPSPVLPDLEHDVIRSTLKRPRRSSTEHEDGPVWPPKRQKRNLEYMNIDKPKAIPKPRPVQVNAVASSSAPQLPLDPAPIYPKTHTHINTHSAPTQNAPGNQDTQKASPAQFRFSLPAAALSDTDPFTSNAKGKARADTKPKAQPPRIDLQQQLKRRLTNSGSISGRTSARASLAPSISTSKARPDPAPPTPVKWQSLTVAPDFLEIARQEVVRKLDQMAKRYNLDAESVLNMYILSKSIEDTEFILEQLKLKKQRQSTALGHRQIPDTSLIHGGGERESSVEVPEGLVLRETSELGSKPGSAQRRSGAQEYQARKPRKSSRPSLVIRPLPPPADSDSEYSPPNKSRAGQFARLQRQGRVEEALEREKRRVSGIYFPETQTQQAAYRSPSQAQVDSSPSPRSRHSDQAMDVDDVTLQPEEPDVEADGQFAGDPPEDDEETDTAEKSEAEELGEEVDEVEVAEKEGRQTAEEEVEGEEEEVELEVGGEGAEKTAEVSDEKLDDIEERSVAGELDEDLSEEEREEVARASVAPASDDDDDMYMPEPELTYQAGDSLFTQVEESQHKVEDEEDDDDMYMSERGSSHEADDESEAHPDDEGDNIRSSPPPSTPNALTKRPAYIEPGVESDREEHRRLALAASEETAKKMRQFEQSHDPDLLKQWSIKWIRELTAIGLPGDENKRRL